jgi:hypothetical protein
MMIREGWLDEFGVEYKANFEHYFQHASSQGQTGHKFLEQSAKKRLSEIFHEVKVCLESKALGDMTVLEVAGKFSCQFNSTHPEQASKLVIQYLRTSDQTLELPFAQLSVCEVYHKRSADMPEDW